MNDYKIAQKVVHWLIGIIICMDLFIASKFGNPMELADRLESRGDHSGLGIIVATLLIVRIILRLIYGAPALPTGMAKWQVVAAKWTHGLMYFAMIGLVVTGLITGLNAVEPIVVFQSFTLSIANLDPSQFQFVRAFHEFFTNLMLALIVVHIGGALFHSFVLKDDSTQRMLWFWSSADVRED